MRVVRIVTTAGVRKRPVRCCAPTTATVAVELAVASLSPGHLQFSIVAQRLTVHTPDRGMQRVCT